MKEIKEEIFKDIPGYEGFYEVSNLGRVFSVRSNRLLKPGLSSSNYLNINLSKNGKQKTIDVHKLVAMAFLGHIPNGNKIVCDHKNNIPTDNRLENLQIISARENTSKDRKNGSSDYVGVCWCKRYKKWISRIQINNKLINLGRFIDELQASQIYQIALKNMDMYDGDNKKFKLLLNNIE